ncbi:TetR/AcrR family transcriptional regulator [Psychromonas sp. KJ10-10]|uniref:TetR/AcrR family transcriptional regulator n=1 Tax=Psychromonas sp. KJ10-10 TaxID=3391823 RepID=UPI0039B59CED
MKVKKQGRRSAETAQETKKQILCTAMILFCEQGYQRVSLRNISDVAGVSHSLIRYHFGSKEQIWYAVSDQLHEYIQEYVLRLIAQLPENINANTRLYLFSVRLLAHMLLEPKPIQFAADMVRQEDKFLDYFVDSHGQIEQGIGELIDLYNIQNPDNKTSLWEQKWMIIMSAHATHSLRPFMVEDWKVASITEESSLLTHWRIFNKQTALLLGVKKEDMIHPEQLSSLLVEMEPCTMTVA